MLHLVVSVSDLLQGDAVTGADSGALKSAVLDRVGEWTGCLILDISGIRYIDSGGLGFLVAVSKLMKGRAGDLKLYGCTPQVASTLEATRMNTVFESLDKLPPPDQPYVRREKAPPTGGAAN